MTTYLRGIDTAIHPEDEMLLNAVKALPSVGLAQSIYFRQGFEINATLQSILEWAAGPRKMAAQILDFACGYGRSTRFLVAEVPPENVWVSDIYEGAVEFQKQQFGVNGFVSRYEPNEVVCDERFDLIFVASLFTHLPRHRFEQWLNRLFQLLKAKGVLAFSVHDSALAAGRAMSSDGFRFVPESESRSLDLQEYGATYVTEQYVAGEIERALGAQYSYKRLPLALCGSHDVYLVSKDPYEDFSTFLFVNPPVGYVDWFSLSKQGLFRIGGWAAEHDPNHHVQSITVSIDGGLIASFKPTFERGDVAKALGSEHAKLSGWDFWKDGYSREADGDKIVEVVLTSTTGRSTILHSSRLGDASPPNLPAPQGKLPLIHRIRRAAKSLFANPK
jgi:2-polyprenyl-3-methyl-5-hydroxy-6-metoxy-1,4-benzoquinol methylase